MRKIYFLCTLLCCSILFLSNTTDKDLFSGVFSMLGQGELNLPEVPYAYEDIELPKHLRTSPYGTTDTNTFNTVSDTKATLGRVLFYDEILSANENLACATCHQQHLSFADETPFSAGVSEDTERNSPNLNDLGWTNNSAFFWDLSKGNLENMIVLPLKNKNEIGITHFEELLIKMEETNYYPVLFSEAYGSSEISMNKIQEALGNFIRSMVTFNTKFDQAERGEYSFTAPEFFGKKLFEANCQECHLDGNRSFVSTEVYPANIQLFPELFFNGLEDENDSGAGEWDEDLNGFFKSPTLRNIEKTAPYMHDGRFKTLREVIDHYSEGIGPQEWGGLLPDGGFDFSEGEKKDLEAFMLTLTDEDFLTEVRWSDPFERTLTSTEEEVPIIAVKVFPNPSNGLTYITFDNTTGRNVMAYLMNIEGKVVRKLSTHKDGFVTDVSQLPTGMYIVKIKNGNDFVDRKLMVN